MCEYLCYLLTSLDTNRTYVGSTNCLKRRLGKHNSGRGAKYTRGQTWVPILTVSGFHHKNACLSFEAGWKKLSKRRKNARLDGINQMCDINYKYTDDTRWNRILDLLYFVYHVTLLDTKFKLNVGTKYPLFLPEELKIQVFLEDWIHELPWPYFVSIN